MFAEAAQSAPWWISATSGFAGAVVGGLMSSLASWFMQKDRLNAEREKDQRAEVRQRLSELYELVTKIGSEVERLSFRYFKAFMNNDRDDLAEGHYFEASFPRVELLSHVYLPSGLDALKELQNALEECVTFWMARREWRSRQEVETTKERVVRLAQRKATEMNSVIITSLRDLEGLNRSGRRNKRATVGPYTILLW